MGGKKKKLKKKRPARRNLLYLWEIKNSFLNPCLFTPGVGFPPQELFPPCQEQFPARILPLLA